MKDSCAYGEGEDGRRGSLGPRPRCSASRHNECWHLSRCTYTEIQFCAKTSWLSGCLKVWDRTLDTEEAEVVDTASAEVEEVVEVGRGQRRSSGILTDAAESHA